MKYAIKILFINKKIYISKKILKYLYLYLKNFLN